jgi:hypothetical protein
MEGGLEEEVDRSTGEREKKKKRRALVDMDSRNQVFYMATK